MIERITRGIGGSGRRLVVMALFALLVISATAKISDPTLATDFARQVLGRPASGVVRAGIAAELLLALWLVSGWRAAWAGLACAALFTMFLVAHLAAISMGIRAECGCLGAGPLARIPPGGMAAICAACAALSLRIACGGDQRPSGARPRGGVFGARAFLEGETP